jgi:hypothetical protein
MWFSVASIHQIEILHNPLFMKKDLPMKMLATAIIDQPFQVELVTKTIELREETREEPRKVKVKTLQLVPVVVPTTIE